MTVRDDLIAARALIDTPEKWCKGGNKYERGGVVISRCAIEAIGACTINDNNAFTRARLALVTALPPGVDYDGMVSKFNDITATTHADILALFDRAINAAEPTS